MKIGIDLGGTKIEALVIDDAGREVLRRRVPTPAHDYGAIVASLVALVESAEKETGARFVGIGIGAPGAISPVTGLVKNSNTTSLIGKPLDRDLTARLGRPVKLANDANCFALSEAVDGAGAGAEVVFGVIIGTGTGGGVVVNGKIVNGANAIGGEWGHNPLPWPLDDERPGPKCYCGRSGCIETFVSGPGVARDFAASGGPAERAERIAELAASGDPKAVAAFERYESRLARSLASIVNVLDPDVIVLGGGVSNVARIYENVPKLWGRWVFTDSPDTIATKLVKAKHGDSSGVRGAAWLF